MFPAESRSEVANSPSINHENCISEFFEMKFTRLEYVGNNRFNVSYMRHTEHWFEILEGLSLEESFQAIKGMELLHP